MIKVGDVKQCFIKVDNKTGKDKKIEVFYTYTDIKFDSNGWADSKTDLPGDFDLVYMKVGEKKIIPGWISGSSWNGLRLKSKDLIPYWKRKPEEKE